MPYLIKIKLENRHSEDHMGDDQSVAAAFQKQHWEVAEQARLPAVRLSVESSMLMRLRAAVFVFRSTR